MKGAETARIIGEDDDGKRVGNVASDVPWVFANL
jgi:hypothetical protein